MKNLALRELLENEETARRIKDIVYQISLKKGYLSTKFVDRFVDTYVRYKNDSDFFEWYYQDLILKIEDEYFKKYNCDCYERQLQSAYEARSEVTV